MVFSNTEIWLEIDEAMKIKTKYSVNGNETTMVSDRQMPGEYVVVNNK